MGAAPVRYEAARAALAEAKRIDDVKDVHDRMMALEAYAFQARDGELLEWAIDIRMRAERKAGRLLIEMAETGERAAPGRPEKRSPGATIILKDMALTKSQSSRWQALARLDEDVYERRAAAAKREAAARVETPAATRTQEKQAARAAREAALGARQTALPEARFGVVVADPEWRFEPWSRETGLDRAPDNHYPTSAVGEIAARDVASIAAEDCVLFLWATAPMLPQALSVMAAWGFDYRSHVVWAKDRVGTGYWFRNAHELLLVGVRGAIPAPAMGTQWDSLISEEVGEHSQKPEAFLRMIEQYFPNLPKIELNRRGPARQGWAAWGNEAEAAAP